MRQAALIGALIVVGAGAPAMATQLATDDLKMAVSGKTVTIDTPLGLPITVNYGANGLMTGSAGTALALYLGSDKDRGRWHVRNGKLCQKWFKWLSGDTTCLSLRQEGSKIFWRSDEGQSGTATIEAGPPAFDGVTAVGLGVPPPPARARGSDVAAKEAAASEHATDHGASSKPATEAKAWSKSVVVNKSSGHTHPSEPKLIQAIAPAKRPKYILASMAPIPLPHANPDRLASVRQHDAPHVDPFEAERIAMRDAADAAARATIEHRWCLSNAFAKDPAITLVNGRIAAPELVSVPSLLAVVQEESYKGELPLHEASCLTVAPAIGIAMQARVEDGEGR